MRVFISWSGARSRAIAEALRDWLPNVIQLVEPWMSAADIEKGARWMLDIAMQLEEARVGLICLTPENLKAPWILFEAGALSKTLEKTFVCPYLFNLEPTDLDGPLAQFQASKAEKDDTRKLVRTINRALSKDALLDERLNKAFGVWWPELEERMRSISDVNETAGPQRSEREILEEILELVRAQARTVFRAPTTLRARTWEDLARELLEQGPTAVSQALGLTELRNQAQGATRTEERVTLSPEAVRAEE